MQLAAIIVSLAVTAITIPVTVVAVRRMTAAARNGMHKATAKLSATASIAITDATPKIRPSTVNNTRSLCRVRLRIASFKVLKNRVMMI